MLYLDIDFNEKFKICIYIIIMSSCGTRPEGTESVVKQKLKPVFIGNYNEIYTECAKWVNAPLAQCKAYETVLRIVFKPFDKAYERDEAKIINKGLDSLTRWVYRTMKGLNYVLSREQINCSKTHFNAYVIVPTTSSIDIVKEWNGKNIMNRYKLFVSPSDDPVIWLEYILKDAKRKQFVKDVDYSLGLTYEGSTANQKEREHKTPVLCDAQPRREPPNEMGGLGGKTEETEGRTLSTPLTGYWEQRDGCSYWTRQRRVSRTQPVVTAVENTRHDSI